MKKITIALAAMAALSGCYRTEGASEAFRDACAKPISGEVTINEWGGEVKLHCSEFKPKEAK